MVGKPKWRISRRTKIFILTLIAVSFMYMSILPKPELDNKYLLISVHDATPFYADEIKQLTDALSERDINSYTLLVVPNWEYTHHIGNDSEFVSDIKELELDGAELVLHGYSHDWKEFTRLSEGSEVKRLEAGIHIFNDSLGHLPAGFVPPMWQIGSTAEASAKERFDYIEKFFYVEYASGNRVYNLPLGMESATPNTLFKYDKITPLIARLSSEFYARLIWNRRGAVRYALHPREIHNGNFNATLNLLDGFLKRGWEPITYSQLGEILQSEA